MSSLRQALRDRRTVGVLILQGAVVALGSLAMAHDFDALLGVPVATLVGGAVLHVITWLVRGERGISSGHLLRWELITTVVAAAGWLTLAFATALAIGSAPVLQVGFIWAPLLGVWTSGSMALLRVGPFA